MNALTSTPTSHRRVRPFWSPLVAGLALGAVLLLTFVLTGHGLGATGASTRLTAWLGTEVAPQATEGGHVMSSWITWQVVGVALGALVSAFLAGRFRVQFDGLHSVGRGRRLLSALSGGLMAGFGARVAAGCTSGLGLSGAATLAIAAFVFLGAFFATGLLFSRLVRGV
jgi:uncharacterized protein